MKRNRMEHEKKIDTANHYDCLETDVREDARKNFKRQPYKSVDVAQYIAKKFGIGGDADGRRTETMSENDKKKDIYGATDSMSEEFIESMRRLRNLDL